MTWAASGALTGPWSCFSGPGVSWLLIYPPPTRAWELSRVSEASVQEWSPEETPMSQGRQSWLMCLHVVCSSVLQLFVGLGFPYEGPAPLEAIANGCAFLNPKFNPPKSSKNTDFFIGKPTLREVSIYKTHSTFTHMNGSCLLSARSPFEPPSLGRQVLSTSFHLVGWKEDPSLKNHRPWENRRIGVTE